MSGYALSATIVAIGPALLVLLVYLREREIYGGREATPEVMVMRAKCSRCRGALVAAELLYVVDEKLVCESCRGKREGRGLSAAELALLQSTATARVATSRRR